MQEKPKFTDFFENLPNMEVRFCSVHKKNTRHKRIPGTDAYVCILSHVRLVPIGGTQKGGRDKSRDNMPDR